MASAKYKRGKDGYFTARPWDGTYNPDGTKHRVPVRSKKSSKDLEKMVDEFKRNVESRTQIRKTDITFLDYSRLWVKARKSLKSINTKAMYTNIIEKHFISLADVKLRDISLIHVSLLIENANGKKRTQQQIQMTFKQVIKAAVSDHLFAANMRDDIFENMDKIKYKAPEKRPLTEYEKKAIFAADFEEMDRVFVYLIYGCGLRRGEALALTIFDIKKNKVTINKAHEFDEKGKPSVKDPKSNNGYRTITIPDVVMPVVENYVNRRKRLGKTYLFVMRNGEPMTKSSYDKMWARILDRMQDVSDHEISGLTAHIFRHNFCTSLCYQIPKITINKIAQIMGDTKAVVLDVYNHILSEKEDEEGAINDAMNL